MAIEYAPKDVRHQLAAEIDKLHAEGWTRPMLQALSGFTPAQLWRVSHQKNAHAAEVAPLTVMLEKIASGEVAKPQVTRSTSSRADLEATLADYEARIRALEAVVAQLLPAEA